MSKYGRTSSEELEPLLVVISRELPSVTVKGGIAVFYEHLAPELMKRGAKVITARQQLAPSLYGLDIIQLPAEKIKNAKIGFLMRIAQPIKAAAFRISTGFILLRLALTGRSVIIETPDCGADAICAVILRKFFRERITLHVRLHGPSGWNRKRNVISIMHAKGLAKLYYFFERSLIKNADVVTAPTRAMAELGENHYRRKIEISANPFNRDLIRSQAPAISRARSKSVLFLGTWEQAKGSAYFSALASKNANWKFEVVGNDVTGSCSFERSILSYSELLDKLHTEDPIVFLGGVNESFGYAFIDAISAGCRVIARRNPAYLELVKLLSIRNIRLFDSIDELLSLDLSSLPHSSATLVNLDPTAYVNRLISYE